MTTYRFLGLISSLVLIGFLIFVITSHKFTGDFAEWIFTIALAAQIFHFFPCVKTTGEPSLFRLWIDAKKARLKNEIDEAGQ